jgi:hypothetical protein
MIPAMLTGKENHCRTFKESLNFFFYNYLQTYYLFKN